jgi:hypothetical protein
MKIKVLLSFLTSVLVALILGVCLSSFVGLPVLAVAVIVFAISVVVAIVSPDEGVVARAVQVEFWVKYIMERLWKDNAFLQHAYSDDQYVVGGSIVHIPQPGAKPTIVKNRSSFPAAAVRRTDTDITYVLDEYTSDPTHIQDAEKVELSYSKIDSVYGDHAGTLVETVADDFLIKWLTGITSTGIVRTTGAATSAKVSGQTGNRKAYVHADLKKARTLMNLQKVPANDRFHLIEENMADELTDSLTATQYRDFSQYYDAATGVIGKLYGFNIMTRSSVAMATAANVINPLGTAVAATNNVVSMCWQKNAVARALGEKKFFEDKNSPLYYGDVYSSLLRAGGRRRRSDDAGIIAIIQDTAS